MKEALCINGPCVNELSLPLSLSLSLSQLNFLVSSFFLVFYVLQR